MDDLAIIRAFLFVFFRVFLILRHEETVLAIVGAYRYCVLVIHAATYFRPRHGATSPDPGPVRSVIELAERGREISSRTILSNHALSLRYVLHENTCRNCITNCKSRNDVVHFRK